MAMLVIALVVVLVGALLVWWAVRSRGTRSLGGGETVALDDLVLYSDRLKLVRRSARLIPEEWKSSKQVSDGHKLQLGTYFILIEEEYGVRPPLGVIVLGDGSRVQVQNTEELRSKVLR